MFGGGPNRLIGGLGPQAPMVATALISRFQKSKVNTTKSYIRID